MYGIFPSILYGGIGFLAVILTIGVAIYLFVDALRHKRNFILWPLITAVLAIALGIVPNIFGLFRWGSILSLIIPIGAIFLYIATRDETSLQSEEGEDTMAQGMKRAYFYIFSFITLGILFFGVADLIRVLLEYGSRNSTMAQDAYRYSYSSYSQESFTRNVSFRLATIIVTLPIWLFHWFHLLGNIKKLQDPRELRLTFKTHKSYLYLILGLTLITIIIFGIWFVYQILNFVLGASTLRLRDFAAPLGYTVTSLIVFGYHFWILRSREFDELEAKVASLAPTHTAPHVAAPVAQAAPAAGQFCPKCGTPNAADSQFCTKCGSQLK